MHIPLLLALCGPLLGHEFAHISSVPGEERDAEEASPGLREENLRVPVVERAV